MAWTGFPSGGNRPSTDEAEADVTWPSKPGIPELEPAHVRPWSDVGTADASIDASGQPFVLDCGWATRTPHPVDGRDVHLFREALTEAERTFVLALEGDRTARLLAPMLHTAACHNLALALASTGGVMEASRLRLRMVSKLVELSSTPSCPLALRINCVRHMRPAIGLLLSVADEGPWRAEAAALVTRAHGVAHQVIHVAAQALGHDMGPAAPEQVRPSVLH